ncbi:uracil DNA N-glycosylase Thp1 [Dipsacomyces acuminosporus]|nr:uracil DNA N-glycosylase Thp1 [Dipsacomyces acuminosporus]
MTDSIDGEEAASKRPSSSSSSSKRKKKARQTKKPTEEEIASFQPIPETIRPNLDILFVGINPGIVSGQKQLHFGNPQNFFWKGLYQSGLIPEEIPPEEGWKLWSKWNMSIVNMVQRTTASTSDLSRREMREAVPELCRKISQNPPKIVCFLGKGIYENFAAKSKFELGLQSEVFEFGDQAAVPPLRPLGPAETHLAESAGESTLPKFAYVFAMPSTSGRTASCQNPVKLLYFKQLKYIRDCVQGPGAREIDYDELCRIGPQTRSKHFSK